MGSWGCWLLHRLVKFVEFPADFGATKPFCLGKVNTNSPILEALRCTRSVTQFHWGTPSASKTRSWTENSVKFLRLVFGVIPSCMRFSTMHQQPKGGFLWHGNASFLHFLVAALSGAIWSKTGQFHASSKESQQNCHRSTPLVAHVTLPETARCWVQRSHWLVGPWKIWRVPIRGMKMWSWCPKCLPKTCKCGKWSTNIYRFLWNGPKHLPSLCTGYQCLGRAQCVYVNR